MNPYELKRGAFKNLTLRILPHGGLRVTAPWFLPRAAIDRFVSERADWIAVKRRTLPESPPVVRAPTALSVWGVRHRVRIESPGRLPRVILADDGVGILVRVPASWGPDRHQKLLEAWEKAQVSAALDKLVPLWAQRMGLRVDRWTVKRLKSRWGSCQPSTRSLVFNARLGAFPEVCLEYVVVHELVHLVEPSHNVRFHALVDHWLPASKDAKRLLKGGADSGALVASPDPLATSGAETGPGAPRR